MKFSPIRDLTPVAAVSARPNTRDVSHLRQHRRRISLCHAPARVRRWLSVATLLAAVVAATSASEAQTPTPNPTPSRGALPGIDDKPEMWVSTYDNLGSHNVPGASLREGQGLEMAKAMVASPAGDRVYVTGSSWDETTGTTGSVDFATAAFDAATGKRVWSARYNGLLNIDDESESITVSPDGTKVYVTGVQDINYYRPVPLIDNPKYATIAYDAATGLQLWMASYSAASGSPQLSGARSIRVSSDGTKVYVTGESCSDINDNSTCDYATVGYNATTGLELWAARYNGPANDIDFALSLAVSPDGKRVYVTGASGLLSGNENYATIAYDAATGEQLWVAPYDGAGFQDQASSVEVSPDGNRIYVTGTSDLTPGNSESATVAYEARTGDQLWVAGHRGGGRDLAISPAGDRVYVTGGSSEQKDDGNYSYFAATLAYDATNGNRLWLANYDLPDASERGESVAVSPDGSRVYVTAARQHVRPANSDDYATVAYHATDGTQLWVARYNSSPQESDVDVTAALCLSPDGKMAFVGGEFSYRDNLSNRSDYGIVAYDTTAPVPTPTLASVKSRKTYSGAGEFDIDLPLTGSRGIECRSGGATGDHKLIFTFSAPVTGCGTTSSGTASNGPATDQCTVSLSQVANAQYQQITLNGVVGESGGVADIPGPMFGVLLGDTTGDGVVDSGDITQTRRQSGQVTSESNKRIDLSVDGVINSGDVTLVRRQSGTALPTP